MRRLLVLALVVLLLVGGCAPEGRDRLDALGELLRAGSSASSASVSEPRFDGAAALLVEARQLGTLDEVLGAVGARLRDAGYALRCPGGDDTEVPAGQAGTIEPRGRCAIDGHGVTGTVWLGTTVDGDVQVSVMAGAG
ncbi:hypothetical protein [Actinoplanes sp. DH11]|uniref:hypothetical protein n=1 Tax=Actinoplanes sp. DH11 TaxID=2857011 RepID=UPI001E3556A1|nr:hypothetical protein [Actinoplanes sp. DH11]